MVCLQRVVRSWFNWFFHFATHWRVNWCMKPPGWRPVSQILNLWQYFWICGSKRNMLCLLLLTNKSKYVLAYINLWVFRNSLLSFLYRFVLDPTTLIALVLSSIIVRSCYISSMSSIFMKENQLKIQDNLLVQYKRIWFWKSSVNATKFIGKIPNSEFKNVKMTLCGFEKIWDPPRDVFVTLSQFDPPSRDLCTLP